MPFRLKHKFIAPAGAASFSNLQWYNQIIFVMVRVLLLPRIIQTDALDGSCMLTSENQFSTAASEPKFIFLPLVQITWGQDTQEKSSLNAAVASQETTVPPDHYQMPSNCLRSELEHKRSFGLTCKSKVYRWVR